MSNVSKEFAYLFCITAVVAFVLYSLKTLGLDVAVFN